MEPHTSPSARSALVTGAASGIGQAVARRLSAADYRVVAADLSAGGLEWTAEDSNVVGVVADVRGREDNERMVKAACELGSLRAVALNAGRPASGPLETMPLNEFDEVVNVNLRGVALGLRAATPALRDSGGGSVVVTASVSGLGGDPNMWAYNAAKGGVVNLVRAAAVDLAADGIRVNAVCPGPIETGMTRRIIEKDRETYEELQRNIPLGRWGRADEVAAAIAFLVSDEASFLTGVLLPVDGGVCAKSGQFDTR